MSYPPSWDELERLRRIETVLKEQDFPYYVAAYSYLGSKIEDHHYLLGGIHHAPGDSVGTCQLCRDAL